MSVFRSFYHCVLGMYVGGKVFLLVAVDMCRREMNRTRTRHARPEGVIKIFTWNVRFDVALFAMVGCGYRRRGPLLGDPGWVVQLVVVEDGGQRGRQTTEANNGRETVLVWYAQRLLAVSPGMSNEINRHTALNTRQNIGAINRPSATSPTHCCCGVNRKRDKSLGLLKSGKPSEDSHHVLCGTLYIHCPPSTPMRRLFDGHRTLTAPCEPHIPVSTRRPRRSGKNTCVFSQP